MATRVSLSGETESSSASYYSDELSDSSRHHGTKKTEEGEEGDIKKGQGDSEVADPDKLTVQAPGTKGDVGEGGIRETPYDAQAQDQEGMEDLEEIRKRKEQSLQEKTSETRDPDPAKEAAVRRQHAAALASSQGVRCSICDKWLKNADSALRAHLETSVRCQTRQGTAGLRKQCQQCFKWIADNDWSWQQHSWYCQGSRDDKGLQNSGKSPEENVHRQRIELHSRPRDRSRSPLKLPRHHGQSSRDRYGDGRGRHDMSTHGGRQSPKPRNRARSRSRRHHTCADEPGPRPIAALHQLHPLLQIQPSQSVVATITGTGRSCRRNRNSREVGEKHPSEVMSTEWPVQVPVVFTDWVINQNQQQGLRV